MELAEDDWEFSLTSLREAKLLTVNRDAGSGGLIALDAHPLLREYFARQLRTQQSDAWREGHRRLYEHLCATTAEGNEPTLEDLQPLYQAIAHGCQAGMQQEVCDEVYFARIQRGQEYYSVRKLGVFGSDLGAVACFFETPWNRVWPALTESDKAWLLNIASFHLRALGRLSEALEPMRTGVEMRVKQANWKEAALNASNLSELELTLGEVAGAVGDAAQSVTYADRSGDAWHRMHKRTNHADAMHQAGRLGEAEMLFRKAEQMLADEQPDYPLLYSTYGFKYCDLLLAVPERAAWNMMLELKTQNPTLETSIESCLAVSRRAAQTLKWEEGIRGAPLLDFALHHLTLGRATLWATILERGAALPPLQHPDESAALHNHERRSSLKAALQSANGELGAAVDGLRRAGQQILLPHGLLTRAWLRFLTGAGAGPESAQEDLDEAWEIAERGPMRLFMADIHLYRARLFHEVKPYPWATDADGNARGARDDLAAARKLIEQCGYGRRKEELEDAEEAARNWR